LPPLRGSPPAAVDRRGSGRGAEGGPRPAAATGAHESMNPETLPLRDLHLPDPVGWWPLAPGWWILLALVLVALLLAWRVLHLRRRRNAARRLALAELARLEAAYAADRDLARLASALSQLLRRAM